MFLSTNLISTIQIKSTAKKYVLSWDIGNHDPDVFEQTLKDITTESFQKRQLEANVSTFKERHEEGNKLKSKIDKIYLIDKRASALQVVVYYAMRNEVRGYENPMQANIIFFKDNDKWKIQNAYIMERSDQPFPKSAKEEETIHTERAIHLQELIKTWTNTRNFSAKDAFRDYFSKEADIENYLEAFDKESETLKENNINFHVETTAVAVDSSTDIQARLLVINQQFINDDKQMVPLIVNLILEEGVWKIHEFYQM